MGKLLRVSKRYLRHSNSNRSSHLPGPDKLVVHISSLCLLLRNGTSPSTKIWTCKTNLSWVQCALFSILQSNWRILHASNVNIRQRKYYHVGYFASISRAWLDTNCSRYIGSIGDTPATLKRWWWEGKAPFNLLRLVPTNAIAQNSINIFLD